MNVPLFFLVLVCGLLIVLILFLLTQRPRTSAGTPADHGLTGGILRDDDRYWYGGFFYNNPDDPAVFVPRRYGLGWTVNLGHPRGRPFLTVMLAVPLALAILGILFPGLIHSNGCHSFGCHP